MIKIYNLKLIFQDILLRFILADYFIPKKRLIKFNLINMYLRNF